MGVPYFVIDAPGGGGKVRLLPNTIMEHNEKEVIIKNYEGKIFHYPQPTNKSSKNNTLATEEFPIATEEFPIADPCRISA
jgi:lysine 2,3-aminomutase